MPRLFSSLQIYFSPLPRRELSNISLTMGAATGSTSRVGTVLHPVADLDAGVAEGGLGTQEEAPGRRLAHSPDNLLSKIFRVELVHALDDGLH